VYPHFDDVVLVEHLTNGSDTLSDEDLEHALRQEFDCKNLRELVRSPEELTANVLRYLRATNDPRAMRAAMRVVKTDELHDCWKAAINVLSSMPCDEVDDFFVEFLCSGADSARPDLKNIADEYFRKRGQTKPGEE
jgi:hypothetical protein